MTDSQIEELVAYIRELKSGEAPDLIHIEPLADELEIGRSLYGIRCLACHGTAGEGDTFLLDSLSTIDGTSRTVELPDLSLYSSIQDKSDDYFAAIISSGISHSGLSLQTSNGWWNRSLEPAELRALILYLRSLSLGAER